MSDKSASSNDVTKIGRKIPKSAILAGAALGLPIAAHADIIYTPLNITVSTDNSVDNTYQLQGPDNVNDFIFTASFQNGVDTVTPENSSGYVGTSGTPNLATPLALGTPIGPSSTFLTTTGNLQSSFIYEKGPWTDPGFQILGVEFYIGAVNPGDLHYGWVSVSACSAAYKGDSCGASNTIQINGFAYESAANTPINAGEVPEPSLLPALALGAIGLAAFRARRKKTA